MNNSVSAETETLHSSAPQPRLTFIKGSALAALTPAQHEQLFDWLELYPASQVLEKMAAPPPDGFGITTHLTTLRRFHARARAVFHKQLRDDASETCDPTAALPSEDNATMNTLRHVALELSSAHQTTPAGFNAVSRWLLRLKEAQQRDRELNLLEQRLALEKEKFEFNAARLAAGHFNQIKDVMADPKTDDEDKIWKIREGMFGPRSNLIEPKS
jgi:hypothetical protein